MRRLQTLIVDKIKHKLCGKTFFENGNHGYGFDYRKEKCPYCGEHLLYDDIEHLSRENAGIQVNYKTGEVEVSFQAYENPELLEESK
ncbi:hypothetical protein [Bacillus sp. K2I17]|uniref:hypothetical protein n=1 Tax=Bacillus sp. K2I17 TaxID=2014743 RepID=UPI000B517777|nr:hypothetical protein [Bacillus sp. K2I17]OWT52658.1 hypothetical protein CER22_04985 [Bacillus sp. K2I17]